MEANKIQLGDLVFSTTGDGKTFSGFVASFAFEPKLISVHGTALRTESSHIGFILIPFPLMFGPKGEPIMLNIHKSDVSAAYRISGNPGFMKDYYPSPEPQVSLCFDKVALPENPINEQFLKQ